MGRFKYYLSPIQRVAVTEKYRPYYEEKAKENLKIPTGGKNSLTLPKSDKSINKVHTTDELAKLANVGHTAYHQAKTILDSDNKEIKNDVLTGKSSINEGYQKLKISQSDNEDVKNKVLSGDLSINAGRVKFDPPLFYY